MTLEALRVNAEKSVDQSEKLHNSFVLSDIFMTLECILVVDTIATPDGELSGPLLGSDNVERGLESHNLDDGFASGVGSGYGEVEIVSGKQLWRHVLQIQSGKLWKLSADFSEDLIVKIPGLVEVADFFGALVCHAPFFRIMQIATKRLMEGYFSECFGALY